MKREEFEIVNRLMMIISIRIRFINYVLFRNKIINDIKFIVIGDFIFK